MSTEINVEKTALNLHPITNSVAQGDLLVLAHPESFLVSSRRKQLQVL